MKFKIGNEVKILSKVDRVYETSTFRHRLDENKKFYIVALRGDLSGRDGYNNITVWTDCSHFSGDYYGIQDLKLVNEPEQLKLF